MNAITIGWITGIICFIYLYGVPVLEDHYIKKGNEKMAHKINCIRAF